MPDRASYGARTVNVKIGRLKLLTKFSGVRPLCGNAGLPAYVTLPSTTLQSAARAPLSVVPKLRRAPCDV